jgi:hypothetical protein
MTLVNGAPAGTCMVVDNNLMATFPTLAPGQLGTLINAVSVLSDNPDPNPNNTMSVLTQVFDICLQDDSNQAVVFLGNFVAGDYQFCCNGTIFTDRAAVIKKSSVVTFEQNAADRRLVARIDRAVFRGTASIQSPPGSIRCAITDRDTKNNSCACEEAFFPLLDLGNRQAVRAGGFLG